MSASAGQEGRADSISLADEEAVKQVLVDSVLGLWDVVNNLTRLRPSRRDRYRVTHLRLGAGPSRARFAYEETKRVAAALAAMGCDIITGGGPGLMQAANEGRRGQRAERAQSVGIRVDLPFEQEVNAVRRAGVRAPDLLHAPAPVRAHLGRLHRRAGRHRHGARN